MFQNIKELPNSIEDDFRVIDILKEETRTLNQGKNIVKEVKPNVRKKKRISEEIKPVERFELDVIPMLRFYELQSKINTIIDGYEEMGENMTYEETCEINTDLTRIENALDNIGMQLANKLKTDLIYKENK